ncbi:hypothetical protein L486_07348 [Kwoniella mangroviensis CBS 10435]|uniref:Peptidase A1 domain-containing protein n=1 Tax=Kwoniella mangroviensis CBS 10435 TaxID=1331196 RepID=A0A1B9II80_9TREE|nr:hypothetical protein L486_07348 [Kwoniella mangroviensis CBS 10435]
MGGFGSKPTLPINALHFRVYSFQSQDTYQRCLDYANTMSALVEQAAVTRLTDDLTFIACYRVNPYKKKDIKLVQEEIKNFVGPQYTGLDTIFCRVFAFPVGQDERAVKLPMTPHQPFGTTLSGRAETDVIALKEVGDGSGYTVDMVIDARDLMALDPLSISGRYWIVSIMGSSQVLSDMPAGTISGCLVNISVSLGEFALKDYAVLAATQVSEEIATNGELYSGTLGLANNNLTNSGGPTVISALYKQGQITSPEVGFYLAGKNGNDTESKMVLGGSSSSSHAPDKDPIILTRAMQEDGIYVVDLADVSIGEKSIATDQVAVLDTGSIGIGMPSSVSQDKFKDIYGENKDEDGGKKVSCQSPNSNTTPMIFAFGNKQFGVMYDDLISKPDEDGLCWALVGTYQGVDDSDKKWVLVDAFLQNLS